MKNSRIADTCCTCAAAAAYYTKSIKVWLLVPALLYASSASAVTIDATDAGWYRDDGFYNAGSTNYSAGSYLGTISGTTTLWHNFFVFDLSTLSDTATSATLILNVGNTDNGVLSATSGNYTLYDVSTPISSLLASSTTDVGIYNDLGSGTSYGSIAVDTMDANTIISISLNSAALTDITNSFGGNFALGGWVDSQFRIGGNTTLSNNPQLEVTTSVVPIPAAVWLFASGLLGLLGVSRRRQ